MPAVYESSEFRFQYPENWRIVDDTDDTASDVVTVESPQGAIWTIACHDKDVDPKSLCEAALDALRDEEDYVDFEVTAVEDETAGIASSGYDVYFSCIELIVAARIRCFRQNDQTFLMLSQAEIRDHDTLEPVFAAMTHSLLSPENADSA